jgi:hypothetical protein
MTEQKQGLTLPCGCVVHTRNGILKQCETAKELQKEIKVSKLSGQSNRVDRANFNFEEHFTEQIEAMEVES